MTNRHAAALNGFLVAAIFMVAFWTIQVLPARTQVATHWGPDGNPDAWVGGSAGQLINPIIALVLWFLLSTFPQGFASPGKPLKSAHARFSNIFLTQLVIQLLLSMYVLGISIF